MEEKLHHVWLMPDQKGRAAFKKTTDFLSQKFGTPIINPHLTLLIRLQGTEKNLVEKTRQLAGLLLPLPVRLDEIGELPELSRCIFWKAALSKELQNARKTAERIFEATDARGFMPHLSLLYAEMDSGQKKPVIEQIRPLVPKE